jgi:predicted hotdog family 3-hydroxylacyl-ACP dehydratase
MARAEPALETLVPQRGAMCLLDSVAAHDGERILCRATSHLSPANPLRIEGRLPALAAIEYAAQAMAAHGALTGVAHAQPGRLVAVRDVALHADTLDDCREALAVEAFRVAADAGAVVYGFTVSAGGRLLAAGRATVKLRA